MNLLPHWVLTDKFPAFYDTESATAIEQTAKVYGAMQQLITEYNKFVDGINERISNYEKTSDSDHELFKISIRQEFQDFIDSVDLAVQDARNYMKENLRESCQGLLDELSKDAQDALDSIVKIREEVDTSIETQNATLSNQNSLIAGAIKTINTSIEEQNARIDEAVTYMQTNLSDTIEGKVTEMIANGSIVMGLSHDAESEELTMNARNIVYDTDLTLEYDESSETIRINEI